jgi:hypothetical protein
MLLIQHVANQLLWSLYSVHYQGFHSTKLRAPACNFLLVHVAAGTTVLVMMALSVIRKEWRRKYAVPFFCFSIFLGLHTLPAALLMDDDFTYYLFTATCLWVIASAICGFFTLKNYDRDPAKADRQLAWQYGLITLGAFGAGFAESIGIYAKVVSYEENGHWETFGDKPHVKFGKTLYNALPEKVGMTVFLVWVAVVGFAWPLWLLKVDSNPNPRGPAYTQIS